METVLNSNKQVFQILKHLPPLNRFRICAPEANHMNTVNTLLTKDTRTWKPSDLQKYCMEDQKSQPLINETPEMKKERIQAFFHEMGVPFAKGTGKRRKGKQKSLKSAGYQFSEKN